jgi:hypothetical protein
MVLTVVFFCLIDYGLGCRFVIAGPQENAGVTSGNENTIVFNYSSVGKQKWRGPYHNKLLFPWYITATSARNEQEYRKTVNDQRKNGVKCTGYYYSATTTYSSKTLPQRRRFPEKAIPPEVIKDSWIVRDAKGRPIIWFKQKDRFFLDVGIKEVQDAVLTRVIGNARRLGLDALFIDNWFYKYWSPTDMKKEQWTEKCLSFLVRARELTHQSGLKLIVNTPSPPQYWIEFAPYLDGIAYEMGAHPYRFRKQERYEEELSSYEKVMATGKSVFLYTDRLKDNGGRWDVDGRKGAATAMLVMPAGQPHWGGIYLCPPRYEVWPVGGWPMWPAQLGKPLGPRQWEQNTVTRKFERGSISVTVGENPVFKVSFEY